jgi:hypothetical protein
VAGLDLERVEFAVAVGIEPLADRIAGEGRNDLVGPVAAVGMDFARRGKRLFKQEDRRLPRDDDVVRELGLTRLDVIKIDTEGAELLIIRGSQETLKRFHPKVIMEVVPHHLANMNSTVEELSSLMTELGYGPSRPVDSTDREWTVK